MRIISTLMLYLFLGGAALAESLPLIPEAEMEENSLRMIEVYGEKMFLPGPGHFNRMREQCVLATNEEGRRDCKNDVTALEALTNVYIAKHKLPRNPSFSPSTIRNLQSWIPPTPFSALKAAYNLQAAAFKKYPFLADTPSGIEKF